MVLSLPILLILSARITRPVSFHQNYPEPLVRLQNEHWNPLLKWARDDFDVELVTSDSVLFSTQPEATKKKLDKVLQSFDMWQMAGCVFIHRDILTLPFAHACNRFQPWSVRRIPQSRLS
jgi:hypothetical protein